MWANNTVACPQPSAGGEAVGNGGALFVDAEGSVAASHDTYTGNCMVGGHGGGLQVGAWVN
jgi:hypothetical protein